MSAIRPMAMPRMNRLAGRNAQAATVQIRVWSLSKVIGWNETAGGLANIDQLSSADALLKSQNLADLPDKKQLAKMLRAIDGYLATPYGPVLFRPAYTKYNGRIGRITAFAPGTKENAAIFCHGGAFKTAADLKIGRAKEAYATFKQVLPCSDNKDIEVYKTEPYVYPEYVIGPGNPRYGEGAFTWLTGSADWFFIAATEWMLGVIPDFNGLKIDPCLPPSFRRCRILRRFRGATYDISIENPRGRSKGVGKISVDGHSISGTVIPPFIDKKTHRVKVIMS